jgi:hypothetical protein
MPLHSNDLSAVRAFILLRQEASDAYAVIPQAAWEKWAPVIETKGCWNRELYTAIGAQLVGDYMVNLRAPVGIYLVGWFNKTLWDTTDSRRGRVPDTPITEVRNRLDQQAAGRT